MGYRVLELLSSTAVVAGFVSAIAAVFFCSGRILLWPFLFCFCFVDENFHIIIMLFSNEVYLCKYNLRLSFLRILGFCWTILNFLFMESQMEELKELLQKFMDLEDENRRVSEKLNSMIHLSHLQDDMIDTYLNDLHCDEMQKKALRQRLDTLNSKK